PRRAAHVAARLLPLEGLPRILPLPVRTEAAMRHRDAVRRAQAAEIVPLHAAGKPFADTGAGDVDMLAGEKMRRGNLRSDVDQRILGDAEFGQLCLRLDLGLGKMA